MATNLSIDPALPAKALMFVGEKTTEVTAENRTGR